MTADLSYAQAVAAWAAHLRDGGTTPWQTWLRSAPDPDPAPGPAPVGTKGLPGVARPLPDAVHLELVRRLNLAHDGPPASLQGLADRVLDTAAPGRGLVEVPLPWARSPRPFGTPAIEPEHLPTEELVRLSIGVLAHLLPQVPRTASTEMPSRWPFPWRRRFQLHGSPTTVAVLRRSLLAQGFVESDWRPTHVVIALPLEAMMAEHWHASVCGGGILKWRTVWRRSQAAGRLPRSIDVTATAARLEGRPHEPVHVVVARGPQEAADLVAGILGAQPAPARVVEDPALSDLLRRLNRFTGLTHGPTRVGELASSLVEVLTGEYTRPPHADPLLAPPTALAWADEVAATTAEELRRAGYAVHGDPGCLAPTEHRLGGAVDRERTLELAVTACLRAWREGGDP